MKKRVSLFLAALVVVAVAVPAVASAKFEFTLSGSKAPLGTRFTATSTNVTVQTPIEKASCKELTVTMDISKNNGTEGGAVNAGAGGTSICALVGKAVTVTDFTFKSLSFTTGGGTADVSFLMDITSSFKCPYQSTAAPFTFKATGNVISFTNAKLGPIACEPGLFSGDFTLSATLGALVLH